MVGLEMREVIRREVEDLPAPLVEEVLDFIMFLKTRRAEETYLWRQVEEAHEHRRRNPDDVTTVTPEEWDKVTAHLDPER